MPINKINSFTIIPYSNVDWSYENYKIKYIYFWKENKKFQLLF